MNMPSVSPRSLVKILAAELLRKGILDHGELISAVSADVENQGRLGAARDRDTATLLTVYLDELSGVSGRGARPICSVRGPIQSSRSRSEPRSGIDIRVGLEELSMIALTC